MAAGIERSTPVASDASTDRLRLQFWPIANVIPSARNARSHSEAQLAEIAGSIRTFGFVNPLLVGEGGALIAGHGRLQAARKLGLSEVPVIELHGLSELQQHQLMLADNRRVREDIPPGLNRDYDSAGWPTARLAVNLNSGG